MPPIRTSPSTTPAECHVCRRTIARQCDMKRHMKIHLVNKEELMHRCPEPGCQFKSLQRSNLRIHQRIHTGEKDKSCPDCDFNTVDPASLLRHRRRKHGYVPQPRRKRSRSVSSDTSNSLACSPPSSECASPSLVDPLALPDNDQILQYPPPPAQLTEQNLTSLLEGSFSQMHEWESQPYYPTTVCAPIGGNYRQHFVYNSPVPPSEQLFDGQYFFNFDWQGINPTEQPLPVFQDSASYDNLESLIQSFIPQESYQHLQLPEFDGRNNWNL